MLEAGFTGGCQCGAVRYAVSPGPVGQTLCHCRMCQRATGGPFAALAEVASTRIAWNGSPSTWASSNIANRGFCFRCGTPLFYRETGGTTTELTAGSLDRPETFRPTDHHGSERRLTWLSALDSLPQRPTLLEAGITLETYQDPRGA